MNLDPFGQIAGGARAVGARLRRLAVRAAVRTRAVKAARLGLERVRIGESSGLRALLAGILHLVDDDVDTAAAADAALTLVKLNTKQADRYAGRLVQRIIHGCQQGIGPEGGHAISRHSRPDFLADPGGALRSWRATELYSLSCAAMRRRAAEKRRVIAARSVTPRRILFVADRQWQFMRDLVPAFREDERLEVRTLEFADARKTYNELRSLFAESVRDSGADRGTRRPAPDTPCGRLMAWADVVFVEWCDSAAMWMSHRLPLETRLVVRLHSYEAFSPSPHLVDWANVDVLISEGEHIHRFLLEQIDPREFGTTLVILPGVRRLERYRRAKLPSARRVLGLVKFARANKDPLMAARILKTLRQKDPAWKLLLVGEYWSDETRVREEVDAWSAFHRYVGEAGLEDAIEWQPFTPAIEDVLPRIGFILSTSERESFHAAVVEGMASGCVPVVRRWPLVKPWVSAWLYDETWLFDTVEEAAARILEYDRAFDLYSKRARAEAFAKWDQAAVMPQFRKVLLG